MTRSHMSQLVSRIRCPAVLTLAIVSAGAMASMAFAADSPVTNQPIKTAAEVHAEILQQQSDVFKAQQAVRDQQAEAFEYQRKMLREAGLTSALERVDHAIGGGTNQGWTNGSVEAGFHGRHRGSGPGQPAGSQSVTFIQSKVDGSFSGWNGETVLKLMNGQVWEQAESYYQYHQAMMPGVVISNTNGTWQMKVDGIERSVRVRQLK